jgi:hypothetical protein
MAYAILGADAPSFTAPARGEPGSYYIDANGGKTFYDENGFADSYTPPDGSWLDSWVDKDPNSPFYGWTREEQRAYATSQANIPIITDTVRKTGTVGQNGVLTYDAKVVDAERERLLKLAQTNAKVAEALEQLRGPGGRKGPQFEYESAALANYNARVGVLDAQTGYDKVEASLGKEHAEALYGKALRDARAALEKTTAEAEALKQNLPPGYTGSPAFLDLQKGFVTTAIPPKPASTVKPTATITFKPTPPTTSTPATTVANKPTVQTGTAQDTALASGNGVSGGGSGLRSMLPLALVAGGLLVVLSGGRSRRR